MKEGIPTVWVCVPTYNEIENVESLIGLLLAELSASGLEGLILVIDDDSPDGTGALADAIAAREPRVRVLHRAQKDGIGPAYLAGFRLALDAGADLVVQMDCDLSHDPRDVPRLVEAAVSADVVLGSRYVEGGATVGWSSARRAISRGGCFYARRVLRIPVRDLTGGFKCFRRQVLESIPFEDVCASGYSFQVEMTYRALCGGFSIKEIPIRFRERERGRSKMSSSIVLEAASVVTRLAIRQPSVHRPAQPAAVLPRPQA